MPRRRQTYCRFHPARHLCLQTGTESSEHVKHHLQIGSPPRPMDHSLHMPRLNVSVQLMLAHAHVRESLKLISHSLELCVLPLFTVI